MSNAGTVLAMEGKQEEKARERLQPLGSRNERGCALSLQLGFTKLIELAVHESHGSQLSYGLTENQKELTAGPTGGGGGGASLKGAPGAGPAGAP